MALRFPSGWATRKAGQRITADMVPGGGQRLVADLRRYGLPDSPLAAATRFGPDLLFSGLYAASLPEEYANTGERAMLFGEDFLSQSLPGVAASAAAGALTRRFGVGGGGGRRMAGSISGFADMAGSLAVPMALRMGNMLPVSRHLDARAQSNAQLQQEMAMQGAFEQGLQAAGQGVTQSHLVTGVDRSTQALLDLMQLGGA
jgi:hypothetical protein